jgi:hypothetical protein
VNHYYVQFVFPRWRYELRNDWRDEKHPPKIGHFTPFLADVSAVFQNGGRALKHMVVDKGKFQKYRVQSAG